MEVPQKTIELPYDPAIPLLGIYPDKKKFIEKDTCTCMLMAALFTIAKTWKQSNCPSEWVFRKMWYMYTMEYYSAITIMPFAATWMEVEIHTE